ncbi:hypothetical protein OD91_1566 [Lutibacter sp. Hel_I_33_5]|uniref:hypothetical protein n=1 Tax=Lutibacter sp. Hel_I_33_5 TaxID=1566289 RepID=UPI0011A496B6|nr:hypothetical protein [Lutibacter sp. Hel_I_33_5]TVZ56282.1 hypothetical protein OD91_1566 [Lutibacter sp. Hel_I_33_5]
MKKITLLLTILTFVITSCDTLKAPKLTTATSFSQSTGQITVPKTNGTAVSFTKAATANLGDYINDIGNLSAISVTSFSYKFDKFSGNADGIVSLNIKVNGKEIVSVVDVKVSAASGNSVSVTDAAKLEELTSLFSSGNQISFEFAGSTLSDAGDMNFEVEATVGLTATLN